MSDIKTLKKITLKEIGISVKAGGGDLLGKTVALISGVVRGYSIKVGQFGESTCFNGDFIAVNALTGQVYESSNIYFPGDFGASVEKQLEKAEAGAEVKFQTLEVVVAESEKAGRGYTFIIRNPHTPEIVNKKKELASLMLSTLKQLQSPTTEKEVAKKKTA